METLVSKIYSEIYNKFHNVLCFETDGKLASNLQRNVEEKLYQDIGDKFRWQLCGEIDFQLQKNMKNEEFK